MSTTVRHLEQQPHRVVAQTADDDDEKGTEGIDGQCAGAHLPESDELLKYHSVPNLYELYRPFPVHVSYVSSVCIARITTYHYVSQGQDIIVL